MQNSGYVFRIIAVCIALFVMVLLTSCGEFDRPLTLKAKNTFDGTYASIDLMGHDVLPGSVESTGYVTFKSLESLDGIFDSVKGGKAYTVTKYPQALLFEFTMDGYSSYYCLSRAGTRYLFGSMQCNVITDIRDDSSQETAQMILPVYLFEDELLLNGEMPYYTLYVNAEYKTYGTIDDFSSFYAGCKWYSPQRQDNIIYIESTSDRKEESEGFAISLTEKSGQTYFSILYK